MKKLLFTLSLALSLNLAADAESMSISLPTEFPKASLSGTPVPVKLPNLEKAVKYDPTAYKVPAGTKLLSYEKEVTASDEDSLIGEIEMITDGEKEADEGYYVEFFEGTHWIQIDLEAEHEINAILVWHFHSQKRAYHDVVVQISNDEDFLTGVTTVFNNDHDNSSGLGVGKDLAYVETHKGKLIPVDDIKGQYVRLYANGNTSNEMNHYIEVEVFGK